MSRAGHTVRGRIIRIVAPPLAAMLVLLTVVSAGEVSGYRVAAATERRTVVIVALQSLVRELQNERGVTVAVLDGNGELRAGIASARRRVDTRRAEVQSLLGGGGELEEQAAQAVGRLDGLARVRGDADALTAGADGTFAFYTELIEQLGENTRHLEIVRDETLRRGLESLEQLNELMEATAQERVLLYGVFSAGGFRTGEFARFLAVVAARDLYQGEFEEFAGPDAAASEEALLTAGPATQARAMEQLAVRSGGALSLQADAASWWSALGTVLDGMNGLGGQAGEGTRARAESLRRDATLRIGLLAAVVLLCLAGSVLLATSGTRSLAVPLALLAGEADRLARDRLPEAVRRAAAGEEAGPPGPVEVAPGATAEVRQVADAFERVQETAYRLAAEQAELRRTSAQSLANLGHRHQNLLRRQLGFITRLEREESDPAGLANLFELDHLATRMRRNAESLLVLVGASSPRRWAGQLPMADVIRAAVSEVEEYRRVILRRMDDTLVLGATASGIAHLLAELVENGLAFSPPDMEVEIHGRRLADGYLIAVCDQGIGMNEAELRRANERLRGDGDFLVAPARFLGHYVVGRLAAEMGARVQLTPSPVTGVTARVHLPTGILADPPTVHAVQPERARPRALEVDYVVVAEHPATPALDAEQHTPNGLRKRVPRKDRPDPVPPPAPPSGPSAPVTGSAADAGARLAALRDGIRRGRTDRVGLP